MFTERMTSTDGILSPEFTVTSLFARSGNFRTSFHHDLESCQSIWYNDKNYESASEALDKYIADFQRSQLTSKQFTGQLRLPRSPIDTPLVQHRFKNRDVLQESLTDKELDFLNLPVGSHRRNPNRLSLSTDDLLVLPCDGSMPVTHTSALLSQSRFANSSCSLPKHRTPSRMTTEYTTHKSQSKPQPTSSGNQPKPVRLVTRQRDLQCSSAEPKLSTLPLSTLTQSGRRLFSSEKAIIRGNMERGLQGRKQPESHVNVCTDASVSTGRDKPEDEGIFHRYPRWVTSQKSEMDFSGITSIPDLQYPAWLQECDPSIESGDTSEVPYPSVPSWLGELEESSQDKSINACGKQKGLSSFHQTISSEVLQGKQLASQVNPSFLRERRLRFGEQLTLQRENQTESREKQPFRDDKIESLILRAETALNSPSLGFEDLQEEVSSPGGTEDVLQADRSWDNPPVTFKSPVPVGVSATPHKSEADPVDQQEMLCSSTSGYSSRKHPGPVEALKQMLFSLQAVEHKVAMVSAPLQEDTSAQRPFAEELLTEEVPDVLEDQGSGPGGESLQRALHHLGRLKHLVDDIKEKKERELEARRSSHVL